MNDSKLLKVILLLNEKTATHVCHIEFHNKYTISFRLKFGCLGYHDYLCLLGNDNLLTIHHKLWEEMWNVFFIFLLQTISTQMCLFKNRLAFSKKKKKRKKYNLHQSSSLGKIIKNVIVLCFFLKKWWNHDLRFQQDNNTAK